MLEWGRWLEQKPADDIKAFFYFQSLLIKDLVDVSVLGIIMFHEEGEYVFYFIFQLTGLEKKSK